MNSPAPFAAPLLQAGSPRNPPLLLLHGFLGSQRSWKPLLPVFSPHFFCLIPDLPGHGRNTAAPLETPLDFDLLTDWLLRLLDDRGIETCSLLGYSMGGRAALHLTCRAPQRVQRLILESASPGLVSAAERVQRLEQDAARAESLLQSGMNAFAAAWYRMPLFASLQTHPRLRAALQRSAARNHPRWMARVIYALSPGLQPPLWNCLPALSLPALLLAGELDSKYAALSQRMAENLPNARRVLLAHSGHNLHAEAPSAFAAAALSFLRGE